MIIVTQSTSWVSGSGYCPQKGKEKEKSGQKREKGRGI